MTVQTVSLAADGLILLTAAVVLGLTFASVVQVARGRRRHAVAPAAGAAVVLVVYAAVLLGTGLVSRPQQLAIGDAKCFDDWCAALQAADYDASAGTWLVDVQLQNRGRGRSMRSDLARAYLDVPHRGQVAPLDGSALQTVLQPAERVDVRLAFLAPGPAQGVRFVVVEGSGGFGPGTLEIGGEGAPFHARAGWPLATAASAGR
ncbi:MAG: hypothetical protein M3024_03485 [Candidatus Dormibacteraeota bacterium]|nr:hypothetical protein [Candidatus Dormibacteraeota bacterium]